MLTPSVVTTACKLLECRFHQAYINVSVDWTIAFPYFIVTAVYQKDTSYKQCSSRLASDMGEYELKDACDGIFRAVTADLTNKVVS